MVATGACVGRAAKGAVVWLPNQGWGLGAGGPLFGTWHHVAASGAWGRAHAKLGGWLLLGCPKGGHGALLLGVGWGGGAKL